MNVQAIVDKCYTPRLVGVSTTAAAVSNRESSLLQAAVILADLPSAMIHAAHLNQVVIWPCMAFWEAISLPPGSNCGWMDELVMSLAARPATSNV
jgi:hypothetical protein